MYFLKLKKDLISCPIDNLINQEPFEQDYTYSPGVIKFDDPNRDFKIIKYSNTNQDLIRKIERGAYSVRGII